MKEIHTTLRTDEVLERRLLSGLLGAVRNRELRRTPVGRIVNGFADARVRVSVNLYGGAALTLKEFQGYR